MTLGLPSDFPHSICDPWDSKNYTFFSFLEIQNYIPKIVAKYMDNIILL